MTTKVKILQTFTGYPDDTDASKTTYIEGAVVDFQDAYAALVVAKGLAVAEPSVPAPEAGH